jgi:predicted CXXCH cytochrome family protein
MVTLAGAAAFAATVARPGWQALPVVEETTPRFVGAAACAECHAAVHNRWRAGRHSKMVQPASEASVKGDFAQTSLTLQGKRYRLRTEDGRYYVTESDLTGKEQEHRVDYTLGNRRIQHYLTRRDDGWIVVLPPSWDVLRREWFHNVEIVRPDELDRTPVQVWNKNCHGCHVSQQERNFDPATRTYATRWVDFGTSCERCHGPGSAHVERYWNRERYAGDPRTHIVRPTRLDHARGSMVCAQCHSLRDVVAAGYQAGEDYYDYFLPLLEYGQQATGDHPYWADGRTRRFSSDAIGLWQSECFLKGKATCTTCHFDPHEPDVEKNPQLEVAEGAICVRCHEGVGRDVPAHTRHAARSPGSSCVECHMPRTVFSIKASIRDHSMSVPAPENTSRFGIPNACNACHKDKDAAWALRALDRWGGPRGRRAKWVRRAEAFTLGRAGKPEALDMLVALAASADEGPLTRANAVGYLTRYSERRALGAVLEAMASGEPLVRAVAALNVRPPSSDAPSVRSALVKALGDPRRIVRTSAAFSLVGMGVSRLAGEDGRRLEQAKADYVARARYNADDAGAQLDLGKFHLLAGELASARKALSDSLRLDPAQRLDYFFALVDVGEGRVSEARERLKKIKPDDPYAQAAKKLLEKLENRG